MSYLSASELSLIRQRPHSSKLWLSIYKPDTVLSCQVNDASISKGEYQITYDNVISGDFNDVKSGMTLRVGSSPGKDDKGRLRVRSATSSVLTVAENDFIDWENDLYLTVIDFFEVWPVYPFYVLDGGHVTWYKDYDIQYTDQNSDYGAIINMGTHVAAFLDNGEAQIYYTATGTSHVADESMTYSWSFDGAPSGTSTVHTPGYVIYDTPGHYTTSLTVDGNNGTQDISYRHVSIYDRPEDGANVPILRWELEGLSGSRGEGGYTAKIKVFDDIDDVVDGALVVIFSDDIYGTTEQNIGGNAENRSSIFFVGYIDGDTIKYDWQISSVDFSVVSSTNLMKKQETPIVSVESVETPTDWFELADMDIKRFFYHFWRWHSTLLMTTDFKYLDSNFKFQYQDIDPGSLYDSINSFLVQSLRGSLVSDRQGTLWAEINPEAIDGATGTFPVGLSITRQDWFSEPSIRESITDPLSYIEMGGVGWSGIATGTFQAYLASAPGISYGYYGSFDDHQGLILTDQQMLNTLVGNVYAYRNARYPEVDLDISGNYRNFDIAPIEQQLLTVFSGDTAKGITFIDKAFHIMDVSWVYNSSNQYMYPSIGLYEITQGIAGTTIEIPDTPLYNLPDLPPIDTPGFEAFPITPFPSIDFKPLSWIPAPVDEVTAEDCCNDLNQPTNSLALGNNPILQSDYLDNPLYFGKVIGWSKYVTLRSIDHINNSYVRVDGRFEKSSDYGITWEDLGDDENDNWHVYAITNWGTRVEEATEVVDVDVGRAKQFSLYGCYELGPGGGIEVAIDPCVKSGSAVLSGISYDYSVAGGDADTTTTQSFPSNNRLRCRFIDPTTVGNGRTVSAWFTFKLTNAVASLPNGRIYVTFETLQKTIVGDASSTARVGQYGGCESNTPCITPITDTTLWNIPAVGSTIEYSPDVDMGTSFTGPDYYFSVYVKLNPRAVGAPFGGPEYAEVLVDLAIRKTRWRAAAGGTFIDLSNECINLVRIVVNDIYLHNYCEK